MLYTMVTRRTHLLEIRNRERTLQSDKSIHFDVNIVASDGKSPIVRRNRLWKQLDSDIQHAKNTA